ncbi:TetR/AcrR family transcriptional regulator [Symbioplanes lichenis]|uniref:TetR/AcrR family transcriptional regulator n=1 Tax=Symbioplanes lichenis TaxID=1629072 RepID=UPI0027392DEF|nr:TetR/AcrR family transcriptional regulator [Actinoplanes lichenis]
MTAGRESTRQRIINVAARLLGESGPAAVTTRAVAQAAALQPPAIYRLFEDKDALLDAVAEHVFAAYVAGKQQALQHDDPIAELRAGWETNIGFALANPGVYSLLTDVSRGARSPAFRAGTQVLRDKVHRIAEAGRLRVSERRAVEMIQAAGTGAILTLLATAPAERDTSLTDAVYDAVVRAILTDAPVLDPADTTAAVVAFRTVVPRLGALTEAERTLLNQWLDRAAG